MKYFVKYVLGILAIFPTVLFYQCTYSTTKKKDPSFSINIDSLSRIINGVTQTEEINIQGIESTNNGKSISELTINLVNPNVFPANSSEVDEMSEDVAILIKQLLIDHNEYDNYKIQFVRKKSDDAFTKSDFIGQSYKSIDLKNYISRVTLGDKFDSSRYRAIGKTVFSQDDIEIVTAFNYYNIAPNSSILLKMYKKTDSTILLLTTRDQGKTIPGNNFTYAILNVADFYKIKELNSGNYIIKYLVNNTIVGSKIFKLL